MLLKISVLKIFTIFAGLRSAIVLKNRMWYKCFSKFLEHLFIEHLRWLLLEINVSLVRNGSIDRTCKHTYFNQV